MIKNRASLSAWKIAERRLAVILACVGLHSLFLGAGMLIFPAEMLDAVGFAPHPTVFFPSQSGIFLTILGASYLWAIQEPAFIGIVIFSKAAAVLFLLAHFLTTGLPPLIVAAAVGDAGMLALVSWAWWRNPSGGKSLSVESEEQHQE